MSNNADDDLAPTTTEGYKVGEKKTVEEYSKLDEEDEALRRWKKSLGIGAGKTISDANDPRTAIILSLALEVEGREDIVVDLTAPGALDQLKDKPFAIKEGANYRMKAQFRVQHEVLSGLKYLQVVKRRGIRVDKDEQMLGSYAPNTESKPIYEQTFAPQEAPSGMMVRGRYDAVSRFIDDDKQTHLEFKWSFDIQKSW